jgi:hypothetical protein
MTTVFNTHLVSEVELTYKFELYLDSVLVIVFRRLKVKLENYIPARILCNLKLGYHSICSVVYKQSCRDVD